MKCVSSCFSCLCGSQNTSRISPSEPVQIIQPNRKECYPTGKTENGESSFRNGNINPNFSMGEDAPSDFEGGINGKEESETSSTLHVKVLYIEVGKDRLLRVIHVPSGDIDPESPQKNATESSPTDKKSNQSSPSAESSSTSPETKNEEVAAVGGEEEEEEYWFSKWARKPRFRSIFTKDPNQRPKLNENNNNSMNSEENDKLSVEMEMARAAAAARRRAWAYNNNGNCEPTITQQPTVNPNDEEEFNSIAIVTSMKQQWMKESPNKNGNSEEDGHNSSSSTVEVEVSVERHSREMSSDSVKEGVSNPAFQDDDEEERDNAMETNKDEEEELPGYNKTEIEQNRLNGSNTSETNGDETTASANSASSNTSPKSINRLEEDAIISEPVPEDEIVNKELLPNGIASNNLTSVSRKPLIFFIHGISASSDIWKHQIEFFQQLGFEIVAPDLLGHGHSSTPLSPKLYFFESLVQDLLLIFDHFAKEDVKVVLVGHGYGACLAAMLTRVRLKNIALLITIAGGGPTPLVRRTCCQDSWFSWKCKMFHTNRIRGRFDNPELKHILPPNIYRNVLSGQVWADGDSSFYRRITVPTLLVYGMRDKVVTLVEECEMERTIPKSFLELIDSAGHMVMLDEPEKLNKMLCKFIQSWS